jgi:integrase
MALYRRGKRWWTHFYVGGKRHREPTGKTNKNKAKQVEHDLVEAAKEGSLLIRRSKPKRLFAAIDAYHADKKMRCSERTLELERERLSIVKSHFGDVRLAAITPDAISKFQRVRHEARKANRTINMDVGVLSRVLKFCGCWRGLEDHVHALNEPESLVGRALTVEEQDRLLEMAQSNPEWDYVYCAAVLAAWTSLCSVEVRRLRRRDVDLFNRKVSVPYGKNKHRIRVLPLLPDAVRVLGRMVERLDRLGFTAPDDFLWFACQWNRFDPTKPMSRWDTAWHALRDKANLPGLRFHDLRHTIVTELLEAGQPELVIEAITGQVSRKMVKHYSHIRQESMRKALEAVAEMREQRRQEDKGKGETETVQ